VPTKDLPTPTYENGKVFHLVPQEIITRLDREGHHEPAFLAPRDPRSMVRETTPQRLTAPAVEAL
jgi:hypothetical protein